MATLTTNKNFLTPVGFQFTINRQKFPNIEYFCTAVNLPTLNLTSVEIPYKGVALSEPGNRLEFSELSLSFNVTENLENCYIRVGELGVGGLSTMGRRHNKKRPF